MERELCDLAAKLVRGSPNGYVSGSAPEAASRRTKLVRNLLKSKRLPEEGWDDATIEHWISQLSLMDSNNFAGNVRAGEREARVASGIVSRRHFRLGHGIGRSGDVVAVQPKAAGSSVINQMTAILVKDLLNRVCGMRLLKGVLVLPMATGMSICLSLLALKRKRMEERPGSPDPKYVLWPRIDQKTCLKSIATACLVPVVIPNKLDGDTVRTDVGAIEDKVRQLGAENILCVLSTTSCFAPRVPDDVEAIARVCAKHGIGHIINNAYGVQDGKCCHIVNEACRVGRVDAVVQSTDKNLMVPVGGAIVAGPDKDFIEKYMSRCYAGRASMSPILDVLITLLSLGAKGYARLRDERKRLTTRFADVMQKVAEKHGARILSTPRNKVSFGITIPGIEIDDDDRAITAFGAMLFARGVSGARVVSCLASKTVADIEFSGYGASFTGYHSAYCALACAIGISSADIDALADRLDVTLADWTKKRKKKKNESLLR